MPHEIRDTALWESGLRKIEWVKRNMPLLRGIEEEFSRTKPFKGLRVALSVHLEAKTAYLCRVMAAGGINPAFKAGDFMLITDHICSLVPSPLIGENIEELGVRFPDMSEVYSRRLRGIIESSAAAESVPLQRGVYIQTTGPNYETPAEIRAYGRLGADAVGMSTAIEAMAARHAGMEICGISCISNLAAGISANPLSHAEVQETADRVAPMFRRLVKRAIADIHALSIRNA